MSARNIFEFLRRLKADPALMDRLKAQDKASVIAAAGELGLPFTSDQFDTAIWRLEERLAERRGEPFSEKFTLWHLMWGRFYLEYLAVDLLQALEEAGLVAAGPVPD